MKRRAVILLLISVVMILALSSGAGRGMADVSPMGTYHLSPGGWNVFGNLVGEGYQLHVSSAGYGTGTQCCCIHLPCVLK